VIETERSPPKVVVAVAVLLAVVGSNVAPATLAVLVIVPPTDGVFTTRVTTTVLEPLGTLGKLAKLQVTMMVPLQTPKGEDATKVAPEGRVSVTTTFVEDAGPRLVTVSL
jgi:hypothetical protein